MASINGVAVFEILPNGCLNGVYSNDHPDTKNEIYNEIARKMSGDDLDSIIGTYACSFISLRNEIFNCILVIHNQSKRKKNGQYHFEWYDSDKSTRKMMYEGTGWKTRDNQITVSYRSVF